MRMLSSATALTFAIAFLSAPSQAGRMAPRTEPNQIDAILAGKRQAPRPQGRGMVDPPKASDIQLAPNSAKRPPESVLRVIRQHIGGFRYSYEKRLRENAALQGKLVLRFTISAEGDIVSISQVSSTLKDAALEQEVLDKAHRMKFDIAEKGSTTVRYSMTFKRL